jgi:hypothetical protein
MGYCKILWMAPYNEKHMYEKGFKFQLNPKTAGVKYRKIKKMLKNMGKEIYKEEFTTELTYEGELEFISIYYRDKQFRRKLRTT